MSNNIEQLLQDAINKIDISHRVQAQQDIHLILSAGGNTYEGLVRLLLTGTSDIRIVAAWALGVIKCKQASTLLLHRFKDKSESIELRKQAAISLSLIPSKRPVPNLINTLLKDKEIFSRELSAYILGWLNDDRAVTPLIMALEDMTLATQVRAQAAESLGNLKNKEALRPLMACLHDNSAEVRFWAAFALGHLGNKDALPDLERLANNDHSFVEGWGLVSKETQDAIKEINRA